VVESADYIAVSKARALFLADRGHRLKDGDSLRIRWCGCWRDLPQLADTSWISRARWRGTGGNANNLTMWTSVRE